MKLLLIYNSHAGGKRAGKVLPDVKHYFEKKDIQTDILFIPELGNKHRIQFIFFISGSE